MHQIMLFRDKKFNNFLWRALLGLFPDPIPSGTPSLHTLLPLAPRSSHLRSIDPSDPQTSPADMWLQACGLSVYVLYSAPAAFFKRLTLR